MGGGVAGGGRSTALFPLLSCPNQATLSNAYVLSLRRLSRPRVHTRIDASGTQRDNSSPRASYSNCALFERVRNDWRFVNIWQRALSPCFERFGVASSVHRVILLQVWSPRCRTSEVVSVAVVV